MDSFLIGTRLFSDVVFTFAGVPTDPTTITLIIETAGDAPTSYVYGVDAGLLHTGPGAYYFEETPPVPGVRTYRWVGTDAVEVAVEGQAYIQASAIT